MTAASIAAGIEDWLRRHVAVPIAFAGVTGAVMVLNGARLKPFWHDEIYTILMTRLPSFGAMWEASLAGVDLSPPFNLWLTRIVHEAVGVGNPQTRVPAIVGFGLTLMVTFAFLLRRAGATAALSGALLPFFTAGLRYAYEARGYGVMMGLSALSMYCWMEAAAQRHRRRNLMVLTCALAASLWNHYFGILVFVPIVAGECARVLRGRRFDRAVVLVLTVALCAAMPMYPLVRVSASQRLTFWSSVTPGAVVEAYRFLLDALLSAPFILTAVAIVVILVTSVILAHFRPRTAPSDRRVPLHEAVAIAMAVGIPSLGVLIGALVTGVFVPRYALSSVAGVSMAIPLIVWRANTRRTSAELVLCGTLTYFVLVSVFSALRSTDAVIPDPAKERPLLIQSLRSASPTVVASSLQFLQLWYYLPSELKPRVRYLADPAMALKWTASDTFDRGYAALSVRTVVPVEPYAAFVRAHQTFRVYEAGSGWLLDELAGTGARIEEIGREPGGRLYRVTMPVH